MWYNVSKTTLSVFREVTVMDIGTKERIAMDIAVAQGLQQADLVLKGGHVFNVFTRSWEEARKCQEKLR